MDSSWCARPSGKEASSQNVCKSFTPHSYPFSVFCSLTLFSTPFQTTLQEFGGLDTLPFQTVLQEFGDLDCSLIKNKKRE